MDMISLKQFFEGVTEWPAFHKPHPAMTAYDVKKFVQTCFEEIEYENQLQRIKDIRIEWLMDLKQQLEDPSHEVAVQDGLHLIQTSAKLNECFRLPLEEYENLREKLRSKLLEFYSTVEASHTGIDSPSIHFFCKIGNHGAMQSFNVEDWIKAEREDNFDSKYASVVKQIEFQSGWAKANQ